jgi:hypothetical protein
MIPPSLHTTQRSGAPTGGRALVSLSAHCEVAKCAAIVKTIAGEVAKTPGLHGGLAEVQTQVGRCDLDSLAAVGRERHHHHDLHRERARGGSAREWNEGRTRRMWCQATHPRVVPPLGASRSSSHDRPPGGRMRADVRAARARNGFR